MVILVKPVILLKLFFSEFYEYCDSGESRGSGETGEPGDSCIW